MPATAPCDFSYDKRDRCIVGDVQLERFGGIAGFGDPLHCFLCGVKVAVGDDNVSALPRHGTRFRTTDAGSGAGDDRRSVFENHPELLSDCQ